MTAEMMSTPRFNRSRMPTTEVGSKCGGSKHCFHTPSQDRGSWAFAQQVSLGNNFNHPASLGSLLSLWLTAYLWEEPHFAQDVIDNPTPQVELDRREPSQSWWGPGCLYQGGTWAQNHHRSAHRLWVQNWGRSSQTDLMMAQVGLQRTLEWPGARVCFLPLVMVSTTLAYFSANGNAQKTKQTDWLWV